VIIGLLIGRHQTDARIRWRTPWQFLSLEAAIIGIDRIRYYINDVSLLLAVWQAVIARSRREN
jgi:hypothetical protein